MILPRPAVRYSLGAKLAWASFDWAQRPFALLVLTYIFAPFFASVLAPDPVRGQTIWGLALGGAGFIVAVASPAMGAISDAAGRKKPWIAAFGLMLVVGASLLWFAAPGGRLSMQVAIAGVMIATVGSEFAIVFHNALMPSLAPPNRIGRLSGLGWAIGSLGGLIALLAMLTLVLATPQTGLTLAGLRPVFALDPAMHEGARLVGPISAAWFALFVMPMFVAMPDDPASMLSLRSAVRDGLRTFRETMRSFPKRRDLMIFLLANMAYMDGLGAIVAFGGIYAAAIFGWSAVQLTSLAIALVSVSGIAALALGRLTDRFGSKRMIIVCVGALLLATLGILGTTRDTVLFVFPVAPPIAGRELFGSIGEKTFLAFAILIGASAGPLQAASRTHLTLLAPRGQSAQYFGYLALSGRLTAFVGPTLVAAVTAATASQRFGIAVIAPLLAIGLMLIVAVRRDVCTPAQSTSISRVKIVTDRRP
jgi:MFS transporter, UMF1 family